MHIMFVHCVHFAGEDLSHQDKGMSYRWNSRWDGQYIEKVTIPSQAPLEKVCYPWNESRWTESVAERRVSLDGECRWKYEPNSHVQQLSINGCVCIMVSELFVEWLCSIVQVHTESHVIEQEETHKTRQLDVFDYTRVADFVEPIRHFHSLHTPRLFSFALHHELFHQCDHLLDFGLMCVTVSMSVTEFVSPSLHTSTCLPWICGTI